MTTLFKVVNCLHHRGGDNLRDTNDILNKLKKDARQRVDVILEYSHFEQTKFYGLQILEIVIISRWKVLPVNSPMASMTQDEEKSIQEKVYLLNMILVQILKVAKN